MVNYFKKIFTDVMDLFAGISSLLFGVDSHCCTSDTAVILIRANNPGCVFELETCDGHKITGVSRVNIDKIDMTSGIHSASIEVAAHIGSGVDLPDDCIVVYNADEDFGIINIETHAGHNIAAVKSIEFSAIDRDTDYVLATMCVEIRFGRRSIEASEVISGQ